VLFEILRWARLPQHKCDLNLEFPHVGEITFVLLKLRQNLAVQPPAIYRIRFRVYDCACMYVCLCVCACMCVWVRACLRVLGRARVLVKLLFKWNRFDFKYNWFDFNCNQFDFDEFHLIRFIGKDSRFVWIATISSVHLIDMMQSATHYSHRRVMSYLNEFCLMWMSHVSYEWVLSHMKV